MWPVVAEYDAIAGRLRMVGNITWIGGGSIPVTDCLATGYVVGDYGVVLHSLQA